MIKEQKVKRKVMFITFEGGEGCGKTTHSKKLKSYLEKKGFKVVLTREPGGTAFGRKLRKTLLARGTVLDCTAELLLFAADRAQHLQEVILPSIKAGRIVICDRFIDSTVAYQIGGRGLPEDMVRYLNFISSRGILPDLTILLDVSPEIAIKRAAKEEVRDRFEREDLAFHKKVRDAYLKIAAQDPKRVKLVDAADPIAEVERDIRLIIDRSMKG